MSRYIFYSIRLECPKNLNAFYMYQDTVQYHCTALDDVSDSKCVSSAITTVMHVKHLHMVGVFNSGTVILEIAIFTVSPEKTNGLPTGRPT